jgi:radical SAM protein (TIGR01212 family)
MEDSKKLCVRDVANIMFIRRQKIWNMYNNSSTEKRYNQYSRHLKELFGRKVYKVTLNAGFSCPNRDGKISTGGCIFCEDGGSFSQAHASELSITEQLNTSILRLKDRFGAEKFISYFQAYSNTYASVEKLKSLYDEAVLHSDVVGLSIGTRPDCVDEEKIRLINSYTAEHHVWVEYGLQSIHDKTLKLINRGHTSEDFLNAYNLTRKYGENIKICVHVILGLPDETREDMLQTAKVLANLGVDGVKIHLLCALKNTELENIYNRGEFSPLSVEEYVDSVCDFIEVLPPETVIHRLAGNGLKKILVAPTWLPEKFKVLNMIDRELERRGTYQGIKFVQS